MPSDSSAEVSLNVLIFGRPAHPRASKRSFLFNFIFDDVYIDEKDVRPYGPLIME